MFAALVAVGLFMLVLGGTYLCAVGPYQKAMRERATSAVADKEEVGPEGR